MAGLEGKTVGQLVISSDQIATAQAVSNYVEDVVESVSADLRQAIDNITVDGYVPLSSLRNEVLKIISANYAIVCDILDGTLDNQAVINSGDSRS